MMGGVHARGHPQTRPCCIICKAEAFAEQMLRP